MYPNKEQVERLSATLEACRQIYNTGLTQRRWYYREKGKSLTCNLQAEEIAEAAREDNVAGPGPLPGEAGRAEKAGQGPLRFLRKSRKGREARPTTL